MHDPASWFCKTWFTRRRVGELKNAHNSVTVQNRTHVYMNFFHHKDLGNHLLQLCPEVVKHPVYTYMCNTHTHNSEVPDNRQYRTTHPPTIRSYIHYLTCFHVAISTAVGNCRNKQVPYYLNPYMLPPSTHCKLGFTFLTLNATNIRPVSLLGWILPTRKISRTPKLGCSMGNTCSWIRF